MATSYGKWTVLSQLGSGGQGDVYTVCETAAIERWNRELQEHLSNCLHGINPLIRSKAGGALYALLHERQYGKGTTIGALKILHTRDDDDARKRAQARMKNEIEVLKEVTHPNLVKILDYSEAGNWFVMEYLSGGTLEQARDQFNEPARVLSAISGIVEAVGILHGRKVVHRDIKPGNVFLRNTGEWVLGDLGLVFSANSDGPRVTHSAEKVGTRDFMATWLLGRGRISDPNAACDVFAFGKLIWWLLTPGKDVRLHYIAEDDTDIRKLHSHTRGIEYVFEQVLKRSVVEHECDCLGDASQLGEVIRTVQGLLQAEGARRCTVCSEGYYVHRRAVDRSHATNSREVSYFDPPEWRSPDYVPSRRLDSETMFCVNCGHILELRCGFQRPWWVTVLADADGCVYG